MPGLSANIAVWGDSITPPIAANLGALMTNRVVFDGSGIGETSTQVAAREMSDGTRHNWVQVFWCGHNNVMQPDQIKQDFANMISALSPGNNRFVIMSMINEASSLGIKGGPYYPIILQLNAYFAATYPNNYLDVRTPLIAMYNPGDPGEVQDHNNDVVPRHLRYDEIHFQQEGSAWVAARIRDFILAHGW